MRGAPCIQDQTHGYTDYPYLDEEVKAELAAKLPLTGAATSAIEASKLPAEEPPTAVAAA